MAEQADYDTQIALAEQRIQDLVNMQATGKLANEHYFVADAEIRACRKRIFRIRVSRAMNRYEESDSA